MTGPASEASDGPSVVASSEEFPVALASVSAPVSAAKVPLVDDPLPVPLSDPEAAAPVDPLSAIDPLDVPLVWLEPPEELPDEVTPVPEFEEHAAARAATSSGK
jgi:hypothetical protein